MSVSAIPSGTLEAGAKPPAEKISLRPNSSTLGLAKAGYLLAEAGVRRPASWLSIGCAGAELISSVTALVPAALPARLGAFCSAVNARITPSMFCATEVCDFLSMPMVLVKWFWAVVAFVHAPRVAFGKMCDRTSKLISRFVVPILVLVQIPALRLVLFPVVSVVETAQIVKRTLHRVCEVSQTQEELSAQGLSTNAICLKLISEIVSIIQMGCAVAGFVLSAVVPVAGLAAPILFCVAAGLGLIKLIMKFVADLIQRNATMEWKERHPRAISIPSKPERAEAP